MSPHDQLIAQGVFVELDGFPAVFIEASACGASQIDAMERMCAGHSNEASHIALHGTAKEKGRAVVSKQSVSLQCVTGPVRQSGFVFTLSHLKSYGQGLFLMYIRDLKDLPLAQTQFTFTFDSAGIMQGWTRVLTNSPASRTMPTPVAHEVASPPSQVFLQ